jgi:hypothetical protein
MFLAKVIQTVGLNPKPQTLNPKQFQRKNAQI